MDYFYSVYCICKNTPALSSCVIITVTLGCWQDVRLHWNECGMTVMKIVTLLLSVAPEKKT